MQVGIEHFGAVGDANGVNDCSVLHVQTPVGYVSGKSAFSRDHRSRGVSAEVVSM
jgi:hypothetical protein